MTGQMFYLMSYSINFSAVMHLLGGFSSPFLKFRKNLIIHTQEKKENDRFE